MLLVYRKFSTLIKNSRGGQELSALYPSPPAYEKAINMAAPRQRNSKSRLAVAF